MKRQDEEREESLGEHVFVWLLILLFGMLSLLAVIVGLQHLAGEISIIEDLLGPEMPRTRPVRPSEPSGLAA